MTTFPSSPAPDPLDAPLPPAVPLPPYSPEDVRTHWAPCTGCQHRTLRPEHGQPRCPGCREPLPAGITRTETR